MFPLRALLLIFCVMDARDCPPLPIQTTSFLSVPQRCSSLQTEHRHTCFYVDFQLLSCFSNDAFHVFIVKRNVEHVSQLTCSFLGWNLLHPFAAWLVSELPSTYMAKTVAKCLEDMKHP